MTNKKLQDIFREEEEAFTQWKDNNDFQSYFFTKLEESFNTLANGKKGMEALADMFVPTLLDLVEYAEQDRHFIFVLNLFVDVLVRHVKNRVDPDDQRTELWKILFTLIFLRNNSQIENKEKLFNELEDRVLFTLHMYLWQDFTKFTDKGNTTNNTEPGA